MEFAAGVYLSVLHPPPLPLQVTAHVLFNTGKGWRRVEPERRGEGPQITKLD